MNKYTYYKVIQGNYGYGHGWEDVDFHECDSTGWINNDEDRQTLKYNVRAYRENEPQHQHRVIFRKELNKEVQI